MLFSLRSFKMDDNIEVLIEEVEKRPVIYDKTMKDYTNTNIKKQVWEEICAVIIPNWNNLDWANKTKAGMDVQRRWQSLRTCFTRELRIQRDPKPQQTSKRRRKYLYFDKLLFLLPSVENKQIKNNPEDQASGSGAESDVEIASVEDMDSHAIEYESSQTPSLPRKNTLDESILRTLDQKKTSETDGDVHFVLSLVPILQSLSDYQKMEAKIQIMNLLKNIKWPGSQPSALMFNRSFETVPTNSQYYHQTPESPEILYPLGSPGTQYPPETLYPVVPPSGSYMQSGVHHQPGTSKEPRKKKLK